jgi:adenylosuccinate lyase
MQAIQSSLSNLDNQVDKMAQNLDKYNELLFNPTTGLVFKFDKRISREETYTRIFIGALGVIGTLIPIIAARLLH